MALGQAETVTSARIADIAPQLSAQLTEATVLKQVVMRGISAKLQFTEPIPLAWHKALLSVQPALAVSTAIGHSFG